MQEVNEPPVVTLENSTTSLEKLRLNDEGGEAVTSARDVQPPRAHAESPVGMDPGEADSDEAGQTGKRGGGNKTGRNLSLEDLQSQFGVGLREAAQRLGARACRCDTL